MRYWLITWIGGDPIQVVNVSMVRVRIASNVVDRRARDVYNGWSEKFLAGGLFHGLYGRECLERGMML